MGNLYLIFLLIVGLSLSACSTGQVANPLNFNFSKRVAALDGSQFLLMTTRDAETGKTELSIFSSSHEELLPIRNHNEAVGVLSAKLAVSCSFAKKCELWDLEKRSVLSVLPGDSLQIVYADGPFTSSEKLNLTTGVILRRNEKIVRGTNLFSIRSIGSDGQFGPEVHEVLGINQKLGSPTVTVSTFGGDKTYSANLSTTEGIKTFGSRSYIQISGRSNLYQQISSTSLEPIALPPGIIGYKPGQGDRVFAAVQTANGIRFTDNLGGSLGAPNPEANPDWLDVEDQLTGNDKKTGTVKLFLTHSLRQGGWQCQYYFIEYSREPAPKCRDFPIQANASSFASNFSRLVNNAFDTRTAAYHKDLVSDCKKMMSSEQPACYQNIGGIEWVKFAASTPGLLEHHYVNALRYAVPNSAEYQALSGLLKGRQNAELKKCVIDAKRVGNYAAAKGRECAKKLGDDDWYEYLANSDYLTPIETYDQAIKEARAANSSYVQKLTLHRPTLVADLARQAYLDDRQAEKERESAQLRESNKSTNEITTSSGRTISPIDEHIYQGVKHGFINNNPR